MKSMKILLGALLLLTVITIIACKEPMGATGALDGGDHLTDGTTPLVPGIDPSVPITTTYVSKDDEGNKYTLEITESTGTRSAVNSGDNFKLTVELYNSGNYTVALTYSGVISSKTGNETQFTIYITVNGQQLTITIKDDEMTVITGRIVYNNGTAVNAPGTLNSTTPVFTSIYDLDRWLAAQPRNTATTPYKVKVNISDLGGNTSTNGSLSFVIYNNGKYVNLNLSDSTLTSIGLNAFSSCYFLTNVTIPSGVTSIGQRAFSGCNYLTGVILSDTVTSVHTPLLSIAL